MNNLKISVQRGLKEITDFLINSGYEVHQMGINDRDVDITIIDVSDYEYEGINSIAECRHYGEDKKLLVINSSNYSPEDILRIINSKASCCCVH